MIMNCLITSVCNLLGVVILFSDIIKFVAAQEGPGIVIAHPGQDIELLCTVTSNVTSGDQTAAWLINNAMGPYRINAIRGGILAGHTATLGSHNLIVENIMMNDDRNGSDYRCVIVPAQGTPTLADIIVESNPIILYVAGIPAIVPNVTFDDITLMLSWGEPFNNLDPIMNYSVSCSGNFTCPPNFTTTDNTTRSYTITNLTSMTNYTFSVVATNSIGSGEAGVVMITTPDITCQPDAATCVTEFYPFGFSENDANLTRSIDQLSPPIMLSSNLYFYNQTITVAYVGDNGIISLNNSYNPFIPRPLPISGDCFIAPYWADFDLTGATTTGFVFYRQTEDPFLLARAANEIKAAFPMSPNSTVSNLLIVTWDGVGYYLGHTDKTNTLQCILATSLTESFVIFLYPYGELQWTTGDDSDGINGLGGTEALAGINAGDGVNSITIPGSLTPNIINITQTSNVGIPGVWMFKVGEAAATSITTSSPDVNMTTTSSMGVTNNTSDMGMTITSSTASRVNITTATSSIEGTATRLSMNMTITSSATSSVDMTAIASTVDITTTTSSIEVTATRSSMNMTITLSATSSVDMITTASNLDIATTISSIEMTATRLSMDMRTISSATSSVNTIATASNLDITTATLSVEMATSTSSTEMITSTPSVYMVTTTSTATSSLDMTITTTSINMDRTTARSGMDNCDCNNYTTLIGVVAGADCGVILIILITNIIVWIYCFRKKRHSGSFSDLRVHGPTKDTIKTAYYSVTNSSFKESELAEEPNSYYEEVKRPKEIKMTLNPAYAVPNYT